MIEKWGNAQNWKSKGRPPFFARLDFGVHVLTVFLTLVKRISNK